MAGHPGTDGNDSEETLRLAYLNSAFESGIKSPLDEAILAHCKLDIADWAKVDEVPFDLALLAQALELFEQRPARIWIEHAPPSAMNLVCTNSGLKATRSLFLPPPMDVLSKMDGSPSISVSFTARNMPPTRVMFLLPVSTSTSPRTTRSCQQSRCTA